MFVHILYPLLSLVPVSILLAAVRVWRWIEEARGLRTPVTDKLLRPPGESARRKIEELNDKILDTVIFVLAFPAMVVISFLSSNGTFQGHISIFWTIIIGIFAGAFVLAMERLIALIRQRDNWRLGYRGERLVGEELNKLMAEGCQVFHDFPLAGNGNLDHIVVAPSGVYAIETKTKRKRASTPTQKAHEVFYDGKVLKFPEGRNTKALDQARNQAARLGKMLSDALQTPINPKPILTLPGWYVISKAPGDVLVLNPKMIDLAILKDTPDGLSPEQIKKISRHLEQKCRDVEF